MHAKAPPLLCVVALALGLALVVVAPALAHAQLGDPDSFTDDPAALAHLGGVETFDELALASTWFESTWQRGDIAYGGGEGIVANARCIPGMDAASFDGDSSTRCGGNNFYLAHEDTRTLTPLRPADQVGFYYGTTAEALAIELRLSDGRAREFVMMGGAEEGEGTAGYFGYGTGDPALLIEQVVITSAAGGIDDVGFGSSYALGDTFEPVALEDLEDLVETCSISGLAEAIATTPMDAALGQRLDTRMAEVVGGWQQRDLTRVLRGLEFVALHLELGRGDTVDALDADRLLECLDTLLVEQPSPATDESPWLP